MKKYIIVFTIPFFLLFTAFTTTIFDWKITDDYTIKFSASNANGIFQDLKGTIIFDENNLGKSKFEVSVDVNTISTGNKTKDKHARGAKWFDVKNHPQIKFTSEKFTKTKTGFLVTGLLEMKGLKKNESIEFTFSKNKEGGIFEGKLKVDRKEYEITGPWLNFTVSDEIEIELKIPVKK